MTARFSGKVALITGGGSGIGRATAIAFAREGATVVVAGRTPGNLDETVRLIEAEGAAGSAVTADISVAADVERLVATVVERHGALDIAVNNAGWLPDPAFLGDLEQDVLERTLGINLVGTWLSMKHEIAHMRANGGGTIVNVGSVLGTHATVPGAGAYSASKAAIAALSRNAAREYAADGIRVNTLSPAAMETTMSLLPGETEAERTERAKGMFPVGRMGTVEEGASAVLWLASAESGFTLGHELVLDGGATA
ncbi:SDR family NAD(P)-dependent oxidoreductase [Streptomyces sp. UNOC14_S4]|uniref:SDR family NAD(P)-dependent oxidoreductase n=1 Tax=Streptomyces sp. UNOC14_S4 TaxID=2872340 RepID=UPI001E3B6499|nr:SDR family oxidoreductase [Streptomyces sp. UNOC14_S4]MCC3767954.1 SDR family oxidoreductase [Streptomyces sp. UNOC14_S4]